jgi:tripartite-type tricarboxylate transporter receptor subunit TctC
MPASMSGSRSWKVGADGGSPIAHRNATTQETKMLKAAARVLRRAVAVLGCTAAAASMPAAAQEAPMPKLITLVVPFSPGASNDLFARALAQRLGSRLGTTVIVENKPGAGGIIGAESVSRAEPDGSVLLFTSNSFTTNAAMSPKLPYDMNKSFAPVALMARSSMIFVVGRNTPFTTLPQVIEAARKPDSRLNYGSSGIGGLNHIATELFHSLAGTNALHVPYKGINNAVVDMMSGNLQLMITTVASVNEQIKAGNLRALAVSSKERSSFHPELPTIGEFVPGYTAEGWWGVFAPGATPRPVVDRLNAAIRAVTEQPDVRRLLAQEAAEPGSFTAAEFAVYYRDEIAKWKKVATERNLSADR